MTWLWIASYAMLWGIVIVQGLLVVGILRQLGAGPSGRARWMATAEGVSLPAPTPFEEDGPTIGSRLPDLTLETMNGHGVVGLHGISQLQQSTLVVFLNPLCEGCHHAADALDRLAEERSFQGPRVLVVMVGEAASCTAFLRVFPLRFPVVCDADRTVCGAFGTKWNPVGLMYDKTGLLVRRGTLEYGMDSFRVLLGELPASAVPNGQVYPPAELAS